MSRESCVINFVIESQLARRVDVFLSEGTNDMKRILVGTLALFSMILAPAASLAQDRYCDRGSRGYSYSSNYPVQEGYYGDSGYYGQQRVYQAPPVYNYGYDYSSHDGYYNRSRAGRSAAYIGGGAAAGAVIGALAGHGPGAAIGAMAGGVGGYLYQKNHNRNYYGRRY